MSYAGGTATIPANLPVETELGKFLKPSLSGQIDMRVQAVLEVNNPDPREDRKSRSPNSGL